MKRLLSVLAVVVSALTFGVAQAAAEEPGGSAAQTAGESAWSGQTGDSHSGAYQDAPSNRADSVGALSPGPAGAVSQSNDVTAGSLAANGNKTDQSIDQTQSGGGYGSDSTQIAGQQAGNHQHADADSVAVQKSPTNDADSVAVLSPGGSGDLTQSNDASAGAIAANGNKTDQDVDQTQSGGGYGSDSTQIAGQDNFSAQKADADAKAVQLDPSNQAISVRVLSPGSNGDVSQSNSNTALAAALNGNKTDQDVDQTQSGGGYGSDSTQIAGQDNFSAQKADADAKAVQLDPSNQAISVRVLSPGSNGDVSQSNSNTALAAALNGNKTDQDVDQTQSGGGYGSDSTQIAGQDNFSAQKADADAKAVQLDPSNQAISVRVLSPGSNGDVSQSNSNTALGRGAERQQDGPGRRSDPVGWGLRLRFDADRGSGQLQCAEGGCGREGRAAGSE